MKFLADMGISPKTVTFLQGLEQDVVHLHEQGLDRMEDFDILEKSLCEKRILLTHDLDFGELIARSRARLPSIIIFRLRNMSPEKVNLYLSEVISKHQDALQQGVIISVTEGQIRVRLLPIETTK
jgi:predicted nuclease of predicted toxin-antitoxin system